MAHLQSNIAKARADRQALKAKLRKKVFNAWVHPKDHAKVVQECFALRLKVAQMSTTETIINIFMDRLKQEILMLSLVYVIVLMQYVKLRSKYLNK